MKQLVFLLSLIIHTANAQWYYGSGEATNLENNIGFDKHAQKIISGSAVDPSSTSTSGGAGSLLLKTDGNLFVKKDSGSTTNWKKFFDSSYGFNAGAISVPSITDNGGGSVTVGAIDVVLFDNPTQLGFPTKYSLPALTVTLVDNSTNYIIADYAGGSPALANTTNVNLINESSVVPIYTIYRSGSFLHIQSWDSLGNGLANKLHQSIVKTQRYRRESGLALGETGTRNVTLGSGIVWTGANSLSLASISTGTDNLFYFLRTGASTWTTQVVTQYNNTDYWNGTTTASLTNNRYAVNWVFRGVESQKHLYVVLGEGDYTLSQAQASQPPANLPAQITSHALLVGRIIVLKSASTATQIDSAFNVVFSGSGASDHNSLTGLQGGATGEYYHLTAAEDTAVASLSGTTTNYVLKRSATGFANSLIFDNGTNVGIAQTAPTSKLHIKGSTADSTASSLNVTNSSNNSILYVRNDGHVGIGNTNPIRALAVATYETVVGEFIALSSSAIFDIVGAGATGNAMFRLGASNMNYGWQVGGDGTTGSFNIQTGFGGAFTSSNLTILRNGNVGVNNMAPAVKLDVTGDVAVSGYQYFGSPTINGSFRIYVSGGALKIEKRISGTWTNVGQFDEL